MTTRDEPSRLILSDHYALFVGEVPDTSVHAHYAVQLTLSLEGRIQVHTGAGRKTCEAAIIPSREPHAIQAAKRRVLLLYLDPTAEIGKRVSRSCSGQGVRTMEARAVTACAADIARDLEAIHATGSATLVHRLVALLVPNTDTAPPIDPRVRQVLSLLDDGERGAVRLPDLAAEVALSPDRLRHLFSAQLGISIRSYRSWARIRRAVTLLTRSGSLTEVAHEAGFADAAHLSNAFRDMFGTTLSELAHSRIELHPLDQRNQQKG